MEEKRNNWFRRLFYKKYFKYLAVFLFFSVWILFFDQNNLPRQIRLHKELDSLTQRMEDYKAKELETRTYNEMLVGDLEEVERIGRERYIMKRDDEDVYIIVWEHEKNLEK